MADNIHTLVEFTKKENFDKFIKLYFEIESNRLKNSVAEHIVYNWEEQPTQADLSTMPSDPMNEFSISETAEYAPIVEECPF
jgi:hypothetical protein